MATDADEATTALIAQMLADDQAAVYGADMYGLGADDSDDPDYGRCGGGRGAKKRGGGRKAAPAPKPRKEPTAKKQKPSPLDGDGTQEYTASGRRKRKDVGTTRAKSRAWTEEEEKLFLEALVLHGRSWKKCADHVGSRDARSFTSHAQKHFIKLCLQGKRLPPKVAQSGEGYTLSGKPLDPNSAAAKAYGFKPDTLQKLKEEHDVLPGLVEEPLPAGDTGIEASQANEAETVSSEAAGTDANEAEPAPSCGTADVPSNQAQAKTEAAAVAVARRRKAAQAATVGKENIDTIQAPAERTEYAKNRPSRRAAERATFAQSTSESLELIDLHDFSGQPGSGTTGAQPFSVEVSNEAWLVMDFHAHLSTHEIIGLLGGTWDSSTKAITVREAFPCRRACGSDSQTSVELDPAHEVETRSLMEQRGLVPVGWYHSHPTFAPKPSSKDNSNQHNYQALFRDDKAASEPFVGIIMGPYDLVLPDATSASTVFVVQEKAVGLVPYRIRHTMAQMDLPASSVQDKLRTTTEMFKDDIGRIDFTELWRPFTTLERGTPGGGPMTKLAKLRNALAVHLPEEKFQEGEDFLDATAAAIQSIWGLDLGYS